MAKEISLSRGKVTIVDDGMFDYLSQWKWHCLQVGYAARSTSRHDPEGKRLILMHREIVGPALYVDHRNGDKLCNLRENLRICTHTQNMRNSKMRRHNQAGYKGVWKHSQVDRYYAEIGVDGVSISLGGYPTAIEAGAAYNRAAIKYFGEFALLNDIDPEQLSAVAKRDLRASNTSGFRGVHKSRNRWIAAIYLDDGTHHIGSFLTAMDAAYAYDAAAREKFGDKAILNFPNEVYPAPQTPHSRSSSGYRGVWIDASGSNTYWMAGITHESRRRYLGCFSTPVAAALAYDAAARQLKGTKAHLNFPLECPSFLEPT